MTSEPKVIAAASHMGASRLPVQSMTRPPIIEPSITDICNMELKKPVAVARSSLCFIMNFIEPT